LEKTFTERFRALFQNPYRAVREMGVLEGQKVVDVGAGKGYFTIPAAEVVGMTGVVYSVEPDPARNQVIRKRIASEGLQNVRVLTTRAEQLGDIQSESVDLVFSAFTLHHFNDREAGLSEIRRVLLPGGTFFVWDRAPGTMFPYGTRVEELNLLATGFSKFERLETGRTVKARFTK
jgi:ubiquinone/menaquinone biosynthesis C-methylase UbiE